MSQPRWLWQGIRFSLEDRKAERARKGIGVDGDYEGGDW